MSEESGDRTRSLSEASDGEFDPYFPPIIQLPEVITVTNEEDEEVLLKVRAKLYRFDRSNDIPEWKERGTGELKMLKHKQNNTVRIVMRRDKTLKVCANHFITPTMEIKPKPGLDKVFVYNVLADFSDELIKTECLAVKFGTVDFANQFKKVFLESQNFVLKECSLYNGTDVLSSDEDAETSEQEGDEEETGESSKREKGEDEESEKTDEVTQKLKELDVTKENGNKD